MNGVLATTAGERSAAVDGLVGGRHRRRRRTDRVVVVGRALSSISVLLLNAIFATNSDFRFFFSLSDFQFATNYLLLLLLCTTICGRM